MIDRNGGYTHASKTTQKSVRFSLAVFFVGYLLGTGITLLQGLDTAHAVPCVACTTDADCMAKYPGTSP